MDFNIIDENKFDGKVSKTFWKIALPLILVFSVQAGFNIIDTLFVSRLGTQELAALNILFPIFFILVAAGEGFSMATNNLLSKTLGNNNSYEKDAYILVSFISSILFGIILILFSNIIIYNGLSVFNISEVVFNYSKDYLFIIFFGAFLLFLFSNIFSIAIVYNDIKIQIFLALSSFILNVILNWFFIYYLGYGVVGTAISSVIIFFIIFIIGYIYIIKKEYFTFSNGIKYFKITYLIKYQKYFIPAFLATSLIIGEFFVNNYFVSQFGEKAIAAYGIGIKIQDIFILPLIAFAVAFMTMIGYYLGKKRPKKIKEASKFVFKIKLYLVFLFAIILSLFIGKIGYFFTDDAVVIDYLSFYGIIIVIFIFFFFLNLYGNFLLQVMGYWKTRIFISFLLVFLITIGQYIGSKYGLYQVWIGWVVAQAIIGLLSISIYWFVLKDKLHYIK